MKLAWSLERKAISAATSCGSPKRLSAWRDVSSPIASGGSAFAIAVFYAVGTGVGGVAGPLLFGALIDTGSRMSLFGGYLLGAALMIAAGLVAAVFAVAAERKPLEQVARPLAFVE